MEPCEVRKVAWTDVLGNDTGDQLIAEYAAECAIPEIGEIHPQADVYAALEQAGILQSLGVYVGGQLVGFAGVVTVPLPHYGVQVASAESLFVSAKYRTAGCGTALLRAIEAHARDRGSVGVLYSALPGSQLETLLEFKRYTRASAVFFRRA